MGITQFGKEPSEEALHLIANGDMSQIQSILDGFKKDIKTQEMVLKSKEDCIDKLQKELKRTEEELIKYRSQNEEEFQRNMEKVSLKFNPSLKKSVIFIVTFYRLLF